MRKGSCILALALMGVFALPCSPVSAQPNSQYDSRGQVDVGVFYDGLSPYGDWVEMPDYGWSWAPRVERGWRPYTRGQWVMTEDGWFWDSDEEFGWAAYHYGRWVNDRYYGWIWVPGTEWAPAWVSWRHGNGYTGWAPLPPRAAWRTHFGLSIGGLDIDAFIGARDYAFVEDRAFVDRGVYQRVLPPTQNLTIINVTNNVTNYTFVNQRIVNGGIAVANVEQAVGRRVPRARTVDVNRADASRRATADEVAVYRPEVRAAPGRRPAQGTSVVKGEVPPPLLVERRKDREQERQQKGSEPAVTAKDVAQRRPGGTQGDKRQTPPLWQPQTPGTDAKTQQPGAQRQSDQAQQDAARQRPKDQGQQKIDAQAQADKRAKEAPPVRDRTQGDQKQGNQQQQLDQQRANQASDAKAQADKRAKGAQPQTKDNPKDKGKDKGKKNPKAPPTTPPAGQQQ